MIKIIDAEKVNKSEIFARMSNAPDVSAPVAEIISAVKNNGDSALKEYTLKFDKVSLNSFRVSEEEILEARKKAGAKFIKIMEEAAANIRVYHVKQIRKGYEIRKKNGTVIGQKIVPVERAGIYVPGGTAAYPSTVLMDSIPAKIAGCEKVVMVTPPLKSGKVSPYILAAASVAGIDEIYKVGGAQAIAALAYGTESIPKVDVIAGPGNAYVAEAKKQVYGAVSIDMIAGPSEILVVADALSSPVALAADMLSQAEHDRNASAVLITDSPALASAVSEQIEIQLKQLPREEIARVSIDNNGKIIIAKSIKEAISISNEIAPEHLELVLDNPFDYLPLVKNAGSVFMGRYCPEAVGDYFAGPNHTLPTGGTAKYSSALGVDSFIKKIQYTYYSEQQLSRSAKKIAYFAEKEGLKAHAKSALIRTEKK